ncbi:MAG TPA: CAP domain-containing protein [Rhodanobacteraceae bacterium]|nr:CAP domain-containing protein [Rhodanobacteraceae bacterium]
MDGSGNRSDATTPNSVEARAVLAYHNLVRDSVAPAASAPLTPLTWDADLAAMAQMWADNCEFEHGGHGNYGQNLYAASGFTPMLVDAAKEWAWERRDFDYATNTCTPGQDCGHYTQMVWSATTQLGCGMAQCVNHNPIGKGPWSLVVCDYGPAGNFVGQRPY